MAGTFETKREAIHSAKFYADLTGRAHTIWYQRRGDRLGWQVVDKIKPGDAWQQLLTVAPDGTVTVDIGQ